MITYLCWTAVVIALNFTAALVARSRATTHISEPYKALPDLAHDYLPTMSLHSPDYLLCTCLCITLATCEVHEEQVKDLLYALSLRPLYVTVTTLPTCMAKPEKSRSMYSQLFVSTHDLIYSGHTCVFHFCGTVIGGSVGCVAQYLLPLSLVCARQHYTIDVLVAILMCEYINTFH